MKTAIIILSCALITLSVVVHKQSVYIEKLTGTVIAVAELSIETASHVDETEALIRQALGVDHEEREKRLFNAFDPLDHDPAKQH